MKTDGKAQIATESSDVEKRNAISALGQRRLIGYLGFLLPLLCFGSSLFYSQPWQPSISAYYYTAVHGAFVATLCGLGMVLYVYRGYDYWDNNASNLAAFAAFGVGLFATVPGNTDIDLKGLLFLEVNVTGKVHTGSAIVLFVMFYFFSAFLFTRKPPVDGQPPDLNELLQTIRRTWFFLRGEKGEKPENKIHRRSAFAILFGMLGAAATKIPGLKFPGELQWFAIFEAIAIIAFAISWLAKNHEETNLLKLFGTEAERLAGAVKSFVTPPPKGYSGARPRD